MILKITLNVLVNKQQITNLQKTLLRSRIITAITCFSVPLKRFYSTCVFGATSGRPDGVRNRTVRPPDACRTRSDAEWRELNIELVRARGQRSAVNRCCKWATVLLQFLSSSAGPSLFRLGGKRVSVCV